MDLGIMLLIVIAIVISLYLITKVIEKAAIVIAVIIIGIVFIRFLGIDCEVNRFLDYVFMYFKT